MIETYTVLHGGFHKTASTFLQKTLQRNKGKMQKSGVKYVPHRDIRRQFTVPCQQNAAFAQGYQRKTVLTDDELHEMAQAFFAPILKDPPRRLILSDENLAGHCGHCVRSGQLYSYRVPFVETFARELPFPVHEIHLSVRNYADFFAAAYVEYLRSLQESKANFVSSSKMRDRVFRQLNGWNGVINVITEHFPHARIVVWRFEDFVQKPQLKTTILQNLVGPDVDLARFDEPQSGSRRPSTSGVAVAKLERLALVEGKSTVVEARQMIQRQFPRSEQYPAFDPWEPWERRHLSALYERDLKRLQSNKHVTML